MVRWRRLTPHVPRAAMDKPAARPKPLCGSRRGRYAAEGGCAGNHPATIQVDTPGGLCYFALQDW